MDSCEHILVLLLREVRSLGVIPVPKETAEEIILLESMKSYHWLIGNGERKLRDYERAGAGSELQTQETSIARERVADLKHSITILPQNPWGMHWCSPTSWPNTEAVFFFAAIQRDIKRRGTAEFQER
jgi:hypothetical protein